MKTFIQCILFMLALANIGMAQKKCNTTIKLVMKNLPNTPIANQEFTLKFYVPNTTKEVKTIPCGPTNILGETPVTIELYPNYSCVVSFPEKSGFNNIEFNYGGCVSSQILELSQKQQSSASNTEILRRLKTTTQALVKAKDEIKKRISEDVKKQKNIDSLEIELKKLEEAISRGGAIIKKLEGDLQITKEELDFATRLNDEKDATIKKLNDRIDKMVGNTIRVSDFACQGFIDKTSLTFSIRLSNPDYSIDTETEPRKYKFQISLLAIRNSKDIPVRYSDGFEGMFVEVMYPMKAFDEPILLNFIPYADDTKLLNSNNGFVIKVKEVKSGNLTGDLRVKSTLCSPPIIAKSPNIVGRLETDCQNISLEIWDAAEEDNDIINLNWLGNDPIFQNLTLKNRSTNTNITLAEGDNIFELEGVSAGTDKYKEVSAKIKCRCGGKVLNFMTGLGKRDNIGLFNETRNVDGVLKNMTKKQFVISYKSKK